MRKRTAALLPTLCMAMGMSINAYAAETKIERVEVESSWDSVSAQGKRPGKANATVKGDAKHRVGDVYYANDVDGYWVLGDMSEVAAVLHTANGYRFSPTARSVFSTSGENAKYKKTRTCDSGDTLELMVTFPRLTGKLQAVEDNYWEDDMAVRDELEGVKSYEIQLYRNDRPRMTVRSTSAHYDFSGSFTREGDYSFRVRGIATCNNNPGEWSEDSDHNIISERQAQSTPINGDWVQDARGWWYAFSNGGYSAPTWRQINGAWYYFNKSGYMVTGWQNLDGGWYYLPLSEAMVISWQFVNNRWYYMNESGVTLTGWQNINGCRYYLEGSGAMLTGWQHLNGNQHCFDASGVLYTNIWTPDGLRVDSWGIWR